MAGELMKIEGARELEKTLQGLGRKVSSRVLRASTRAGGAVIRQAMKDRAPKLSGKLRRKVTLKARRGTRTEFRVSIGPTEEAFYGKFQEFGTRFQPARPWLRPAFDHSKTQAARAVMSKLWERIRLELSK